MKQIRTERLTVAEANNLLEVDMEPGFWAALIGLISYPELSFEPATQSVLFPSYVPFKELAKEWIEGIETGIYEIRLCEHCANYYDLNRMDGIWAIPDKLEGFICRPCAERMSALEFFEKYLA